MPNNVFLTGVTGFVGRYLLYQLCDADWIDEVYVMVRAKKGVTVEDRLASVLDDDLIKESKKTGTKYDKIHIIVGDCHKPKLGISESDLDLLSKKLTLVLHNAAVLNFAGTIQDSIRSNTTPTWELYKLCCERFELKPSFVFVSTIATNSHLDVIPEKVTPFSAPAEYVYNYARSIPAERAEEARDFLKEGRLDAYGLSKGLVERMIYEHIEETGGVVPVNFVRPGGIISSWGGPLPAWIHNTCFYGTLAYQIHEGKLPFFLADGNQDINMAPVDYVGNLTMASCLECLEKRENKQFKIDVANGSKIRVQGLNINYMLKFAHEHYTKYKELTKTKAPWVDFSKNEGPRKPILLQRVWLFDLIFQCLIFFPLWLYSFWDSTSYRYTKVSKLLRFLHKFAKVLGPYLSQPLEYEHGHLESLHKRYGKKYPCDASDIDRSEFLDKFYKSVALYIIPHERMKEKKQWEKFSANGSKAKVA